MPRFLIKLHDEEKNKDWFLEWSTIVDAPVSYGMSKTELEEYIKEEYGNEGLKELPARLDRVEKNGHSLYENRKVEDLIEFNRAGPKEGKLTIKGLIKHFCKEN